MKTGESNIENVCMHDEYWPANLNVFTAQDCMDLCFMLYDCPQADFYPHDEYPSCWVFRECSVNETGSGFGGYDMTFFPCYYIGM